MLTGTNLKYTKAYNHRIVLETIRLHGPLARADIARRTELTAQTISNIVKKLIEGGLIREARKRRDGRGAPSTMLELNPNAAYSIGLDLDKDHLTAVLVDLSGAVRQRYHEELDFPSPDETVTLMTEVTELLLDRENLSQEDVGGIGIGFPGPMEVTKGNLILNQVNPKAFPGWQHVPLVDMLDEHLSPPIFLENNATAAAVGERWYGDGQHISTFFYLFFGAGLGGGVILNGEPYDGHSRNAGELGYLPVDPHSNGAARHCGEHFNLPTLYRSLQEEGLDVTTPDDLLRLFRQDNEQMIRWIHEATERLILPLLSIEYLLDPETIFFGGRLPRPLIAEIIDQLGEALEEARIEGKSLAPSLQCATAGADAAALGVATLPMYELFAPTPQLLMKRKANTNLPAID